MTYPRRLAVILLPLGVLALGCFGTSKRETNSRHTPEVQTGVGASIIWPGQGAAMPYPRGGAPLGQPAAGAPATQAPTGVQQPGNPAQTYPPQGAASSGGGGFTYLGGATQEQEKNTKLDSKVVGTPDVFLLNVITAPFAAVAAVIAKPFLHDRDGREAAKQAVPAPSGALPPQLQPQQSTRPPDAQTAHDRAELDSMERELAARRGVPSAQPHGSTASPPPAGGIRQSSAGTLSIAEELAALRRPSRSAAPHTEAPVASHAAPQAQTSPPPLPSHPLPEGATSQVSDRNHDGRPDYWATRVSGQLLKEVFDDDGDGRPDKIVRYDSASGKEQSAEEDTNKDGRMDAWTEYQNGVPVRLRRDTNFDGHLDSWSFYRGGKLARREQDTNGDGFRDRLAVYEAGHLVREQLDRNGDGRVDRVTLYDAQQRPTRRDEDRDGDGLIDTRSIYENGRLARREFVNEQQQQQPIEGRALGATAWEAGQEQH